MPALHVLLWLRIRLCLQMLAPSHSSHRLLIRLCWQMLAPPRSLHWLFCPRCWQMLAPRTRYTCSFFDCAGRCSTLRTPCTCSFPDFAGRCSTLCAALDMSVKTRAHHSGKITTIPAKCQRSCSRSCPLSAAAALLPPRQHYRCTAQPARLPANHRRFQETSRGPAAAASTSRASSQSKLRQCDHSCHATRGP